MTKPSLLPGLREGVRRFFDFEADRLTIATGESEAPPPLVSTGRFGLVGLQELREVLGPRWSALEERVRALAEAVIARHLTPGDVFERQEDGSYVVLFARLASDAAEFKCRVIGREITERLLGSDSPRLADVETVSAEVSRDALAGEDAERVVEAALAAAVPTISCDPASPRTLSTLAALRPIDHDGVLQSRLPGWRDLEAGRKASSPTPAAVESGHRRAVKPGLVWRYSPVWDFRSMSLVRFRLTAGGCAVTEEESADFDMDVRVVSKAVDDLSKLAAEGRRLSVICAIHESSLGVQWRRDQLIDLLAQAGPDIRRMLSVELLAPVFAPTPTAMRFLEALRPLSMRGAICVPVGIRQPPRSNLLSTAAMDLHACPSQPDARRLEDLRHRLRGRKAGRGRPRPRQPFPRDRSHRSRRAVPLGAGRSRGS